MTGASRRSEGTCSRPNTRTRWNPAATTTKRIRDRIEKRSLLEGDSGVSIATDIAIATCTVQLMNELIHFYCTPQRKFTEIQIQQHNKALNKISFLRAFIVISIELISEYHLLKMARLKRFCCDDETGEVITYQVNDETGERALINKLPKIYLVDRLSNNRQFLKFPSGCHKKNKNLKDKTLYYRSPFHVITSTFCGWCRECDMASKIGQIQDKRRYKYDYLRGAL
ncbi:jg9784 [Pararge aegeria aegeria]|uniref:Jg9784 protein n=1 Tax=Pararge aegeria aegeria TaxID=348720 RepID=A0A8S4RLF2_9NEOP|nr:jg9784 [Pararge aegeria aegeria]